jgi:hypothetical protein
MAILFLFALNRLQFQLEACQAKDSRCWWKHVTQVMICLEVDAPFQLLWEQASISRSIMIKLWKPWIVLLVTF